MIIYEPKPYEAPEDGYDWCASCNYLTEVAATISPDGIEPLQPLCAECNSNLKNGE